MEHNRRWGDHFQTPDKPQESTLSKIAACVIMALPFIATACIVMEVWKQN